MNKEQLYHKILESRDETQHLISQFWSQYSNINTWYFWFVLLSMIISFVILYFAIDKKRIFEISFYGYSVHVIWTKVDDALASHNFLVHPHSITSFIPNGANMTTVILPIAFMLLYQYCTNHGKNFYLWAIVLSIIFSFGFTSLESAVGLLKMHNGMSKFYVFLIDIAIAFIAYWMTLLFRWVKHRYLESQEQ